MIEQKDLVKRWGVSRSAVSQMVAAGCPLTTPEAADAWRMANRGWSGEKKSTTLSCSSGADQHGETASDANGGGVADGLAGMLERIRAAEVDAHRSYLAAAKDPERADQAAALLRNWKSVAEMRVDAEKNLHAQLRSVRALLTMAEVEEVVSGVLGEIPKIMRRWPSTLGPRCNPADPVLAERHLAEAVEKFFIQINKAVRRDEE